MLIEYIKTEAQIQKEKEWRIGFALFPRKVSKTRFVWLGFYETRWLHDTMDTRETRMPGANECHTEHFLEV